MLLQTVICSVMLGAVFYLFFERDRKAVLALVGVASVLLGLLTPFIQWHGSGMENAITHVLMLSTLYVLWRSALRGRIDYFLASVPFLASISRTEGIFHLAPLLAVFSIYWRVVERSYAGVRFSLVVLALWGLFNAWRVTYFGSFFPNTAAGQGISLGERLSRIAALDGDLLLTSLDYAVVIFLAHGGLLLIALCPALLLVRPTRPDRLLLSLCMSLTVTALLNPLVFGPTRLDVSRSTTHLAVVVVLQVVLLVHLLRAAARSWSSAAAAACAMAVATLTYIPRYPVCCGIADFDAWRRTFEDISRREDLPRPTVANPDLGIVSWHKQFNIVDLGRLGSIIPANLRDGPAFSDYFFDFAAPDIIESHEYWSCLYSREIFEDARFRERYVPLQETPMRVRHCPNQDILAGIWVRRSVMGSADSAERRLIDALKAGAGVPEIASELDACRSTAPVSRTACLHVARTVYRFRPELQAKGILGDVVRVFEARGASPFELFLLRGADSGAVTQAALRDLRRVSPL